MLSDVKLPFSGRVIEYTIALISGLVAWSIFIIHHPLHDHQLSIVSIVQEGSNYGRPLYDLFGKMTANADILIYNYLFSILLQVAAAGVLIERLQLSRWPAIGLILLFMTHPIWLGYFYYSNAVAMFIFASFLSTCAAVYLKPDIRLFISALIAAASVMIYQASIAVFPVAVCLIGINGLLQGQKTQFYWVRFYAGGVFALGLAAAFYLVVINFFGFTGSHASAISSSGTLERITRVVLAAFRHFWIDQPDFPIHVRLLQLGTILTSVVVIFWRTDRRRWLLLAVSLFAAVVATKAVFLISMGGQGDSIFQYRHNTGLILLIAGIAGIALSALQGTRFDGAIGRTLQTTSLATLALVFVQQDLIRQSVLHYGQIQDLAIMNRVIARIEQHPDFNPNQRYQLVRTGPLSNFRRERLAEQNGAWTVLADEHMDFGSIGNLWVPESSAKLLGSKVLFIENNIANWRVRSLRWRQYAVNQGIPVWPAEESLWFAGNEIVLHTRF